MLDEEEGPFFNGEVAACSEHGATSAADLALAQVALRPAGGAGIRSSALARIVAIAACAAAGAIVATGSVLTASQHRGAAVADAISAAGELASQAGVGQQAPALQDPAPEQRQIEPSNEKCQILWRLTIAQAVAQGFGSRMLYFATFYERFGLWPKVCTFLLSEDTANGWESWGLDPPGFRVTREDWKEIEKLPQDSIDENYKLTIVGPWTGEALGGGFWTHHGVATSLSFTDLAGCWSTFDKTLWRIFGGLVQRRSQPIGRDYIGMHIRHGDKVAEGPIVDIKDLMEHAKYRGMRDIFVATDDSAVIGSELGPYKSRGFVFNWTTYNRRVRGEPTVCRTSYCAHNSERESIQAVITDTLGLAKASVLIGSFNSNFFRLAWVLNYLRRTPEERALDWCYDAFTGMQCGDRHSFVTQFVSSGLRERVPPGLLPDNPGIIQDCTNPFGR